MAKKAELEDAHNRYYHSCAAVARAEGERDFHAVVRGAQASLALVHPAVTFQRRFLKLDEPATPTIDCLLRYAPPLFLAQALDAVEAWYLSGTRTERNALPDMPNRLTSARDRLTLALELWAVLAAQPTSTLRPENPPPAVTGIVAVWLGLGAIMPRPHAGPPEYARVSDPRRPVQGKCSECGRVLAVPLSRLLDPFPCPGCRRSCPFVVVRRID